MTSSTTSTWSSWDNGSARGRSATALDALAARFDRVRVLHQRPRTTASRSATTSASPSAPATSWSSSTTTRRCPPAGWRRCGRRSRTRRSSGVQPLLLYPTGTIQSAGVAFPTTGGLPHNFLAGFPAEDAAGVDGLRFHALTGAALALRTEDVVALRGFDPVFTNGMEDVDLCQRLAALRPGHFRVVTDVPVVHHESRTAGPLRQVAGQPGGLPRPLAGARRAPRRRRPLGRVRAAGGRPRGRAGPARRAPALPDPAAGAGPRGPARRCAGR